MNWGHGILLVSIAFIVGMLSMVFVASRQTNEMIETNYYQKELQYQHTIDAMQNLANTGKHVIVSQNGQALSVLLPSQTATDIDSGKVELLFLTDKGKDKLFRMSGGNDSLNSIPLADLQTGGYKLRVYWISNQVNYYYEEIIAIRK